MPVLLSWPLYFHHSPQVLVEIENGVRSKIIEMGCGKHRTGQETTRMCKKRLLKCYYMRFHHSKAIDTTASSFYRRLHPNDFSKFCSFHF
ncbi:hypothetical protein CIPAW_01G151400 [Carya illinoinensis]|uniref:Uncharacterized protein n=1 Tax=Carya illinoinensis TaxID=32201 RepID=A0A8T1RLD1_CARIL|nr:hypothetical protein CIPAW_01G151400 [Carya illinoinensis]